MERVAIEMKSISSKDLALRFALFGTPPIYAVVSLVDSTRCLQSHSTQFNRNRDHHKEWDQQMRFVLPVKVEDSFQPIFLQIEFVSRRGVAGVLGDQVIGKARVSVRDLMTEYNSNFGGPGERFRSTAFQVQSTDKKPAGVVSFLYRIRQGREAEGMQAPAPDAASFVKPTVPVGDCPPTPASTSENSAAVQQQGAMFYYCCPSPVTLPTTGPSGYPAADYDNFAWNDSVQSWPAPPAAAPRPSAYGDVWNGYRWSGDAWATESGAHPAHMYR